MNAPDFTTRCACRSGRFNVMRATINLAVPTAEQNTKTASLRPSSASYCESWEATSSSAKSAQSHLHMATPSSTQSSANQLRCLVCLGVTSRNHSKEKDNLKTTLEMNVQSQDLDAILVMAAIVGPASKFTIVRSVNQIVTPIKLPYLASKVKSW